MTDILKIALDNRAKLHEEAAKLNEFIRYGEALMRNVESGASNVAEMPRQMSMAPMNDEAHESTDVPRPDVIRRGA